MKSASFKLLLPSPEDILQNFHAIFTITNLHFHIEISHSIKSDYEEA